MVINYFTFYCTLSKKIYKIRKNYKGDNLSCQSSTARSLFNCLYKIKRVLYVDPYSGAYWSTTPWSVTLGSRFGLCLLTSVVLISPTFPFHLRSTLIMVIHSGHLSRKSNINSSVLWSSQGKIWPSYCNAAQVQTMNCFIPAVMPWENESMAGWGWIAL